MSSRRCVAELFSQRVPCYAMLLCWTRPAPLGTGVWLTCMVDASAAVCGVAQGWARACCVRAVIAVPACRWFTPAFTAAAFMVTGAAVDQRWRG